MKNKISIILLLINISLSQEVIGEGLYGDELISFLQQNYKTSNTLGYTNARDTLYLRVERNNNGQVKGVYTNYSVSLPNGVDPSTHLYENGINCEHVWPQSLGAGSEPQKSDMHIIRPCKDNVNSARGNKPFNDVIDSQTTTWYFEDQQTSNVPSSNIDEYSENHGSYFEPREDRKGDVARTIFYFKVMYSDIADENFFNQQKEILKNWHLQDPANEDEIARTWKIADYQQNKPNPFVLDESLIVRSFFEDEFILGDINGDGNLNILDVVELINQILSGQNTTECDINGDGGVNILDVVALVNLVLN